MFFTYIHTHLSMNMSLEDEIPGFFFLSFLYIFMDLQDEIPLFFNVLGEVIPCWKDSLPC